MTLPTISLSDTSQHVRVLSVGRVMLAGEMSRHTTFKFCLDPAVGQHEVLARHAGASRFAFNQCLRTVKTALTRRIADPDVDVPWTGFDLINAFNAWKKTEDAGRVFVVGASGETAIVVTGLAWRADVCQQVLEEAAVDCDGRRRPGRTRAANCDGTESRGVWTSCCAGVGLPAPADGTALTSTLRVPVKPARLKREPTFTPRQRPEPTTPEKGGADHST